MDILIFLDLFECAFKALFILTFIYLVLYRLDNTHKFHVKHQIMTFCLMTAYLFSSDKIFAFLSKLDGLLN